MLRGEVSTYEHRSDESHRWLRFEFCQALPGVRAVGLGTFDDPKWLKLNRFGWYRSGHSWVKPPPDVEVFEKSSLPPPNSVRRT